MALEQQTRHPPLPARPPIMSISQQLERYLVMAALISTCFPTRPRTFCISGRHHKGRKKPQGWKVGGVKLSLPVGGPGSRRLNRRLNRTPRLYSKAFTGWTRSIPRCSYCLQDKHPTHRCLQNPEHPWMTWPTGVGSWHGMGTGPSSCSSSHKDPLYIVLNLITDFLRLTNLLKITVLTVCMVF